MVLRSRPVEKVGWSAVVAGPGPDSGPSPEARSPWGRDPEAGAEVRANQSSHHRGKCCCSYCCWSQVLNLCHCGIGPRTSPCGGDGKIRPRPPAAQTRRSWAERTAHRRLWSRPTGLSYILWQKAKSLVWIVVVLTWFTSQRRFLFYLYYYWRSKNKTNKQKNISCSTTLYWTLKKYTCIIGVHTQGPSRSMTRLVQETWSTEARVWTKVVHTVSI